MRPPSGSRKTSGEGLTPSAGFRRLVSGHLPALDGLRGIAILLVLIFHVFWTPLPLPGLPGKLLPRHHELRMDGGGVVLCPFGIPDHGHSPRQPRGRELPLSFLRRALRILPLSYATLFAAFILCPVLGKLGVPFLPGNFPRLNSGTGFMRGTGRGCEGRPWPTSPTSGRWRWKNSFTSSGRSLYFSPAGADSGQDLRDPNSRCAGHSGSCFMWKKIRHRGPGKCITPRFPTSTPSALDRFPR